MLVHNKHLRHFYYRSSVNVFSQFT